MNPWDCIVIGAGPAGSALATLLARRGHRVLVLERERFPRFQIGESLLPVCLPVLERLGLQPHEDTHVHKAGAQFLSEDLGQRRRFDFQWALPGPPRHAYQVDRAAFDHALARIAERAGAQFHYGADVEGVVIDEGGVTVRAGADEYHGRYLLDASGQGRFLARRMKSAVPYDGFGHSAAFTHLHDVHPDVCAELAEHNDIRIFLVPEGWGWVIPLPHRRLSLGLVTKRHGVTRDLERHLTASPVLQRWASGAQRSGGRAARNFSYRNTKSFGARYTCVGDAACFLDPVFSSGVSLALVGAQRTADRLSDALDAGHEAEPALMQPIDLWMSRAYRTFAAIIDRFYNTHFVRNVLFANERDETLTREIVSVLSGDVWRHDNAFQNMLLAARRRQSGTEPPDLRPSPTASPSSSSPCSSSRNAFTKG